MKIEFSKVELRKTDLELIDKISERRGIPRERVTEIMKHACWTPKQFADITGKHPSTINNLTVYGKQVDREMVTALNVCSSFPDKDTSGPKFIVRDALSMGILRKSL